MRALRASAKNRQLVFRAVEVYWIDHSKGASTLNLATKTGLPWETVEACCNALLEARVITATRVGAWHVLWQLVVLR